MMRKAYMLGDGTSNPRPPLQSAHRGTNHPIIQHMQPPPAPRGKPTLASSFPPALVLPPSATALGDVANCPLLGPGDEAEPQHSQHAHASILDVLRDVHCDDERSVMNTLVSMGGKVKPVATTGTDQSQQLTTDGSLVSLLDMFRNAHVDDERSVMHIIMNHCCTESLAALAQLNRIP